MTCTSSVLQCFFSGTVLILRNANFSKALQYMFYHSTAAEVIQKCYKYNKLVTSTSTADILQYLPYFLQGLVPRGWGRATWYGILKTRVTCKHGVSGTRGTVLLPFTFARSGPHREEVRHGTGTVRF